MSNPGQNKIDWDYWLSKNGIKDFELILLTMHIEPKSEDADYFDGVWFLHRIEDDKDLNQVYQKRLELLNDWRYVPFDDLPAVDGLAFDTFNHGSKHGEINLKRFLVWYTKEGKNWADMPQEMLAMAELEAQKINSKLASKEPQKPINKLDNGKEFSSTSRANENDLKLIGALLEILHTKPTKQILNQSAIVAEIVEKYDYIGLRESALNSRFSSANKALAEAKKQNN
jgi:hypothetical protein